MQVAFACPHGGDTVSGALKSEHLGSRPDDDTALLRGDTEIRNEAKRITIRVAGIVDPADKVAAERWCGLPEFVGIQYLTGLSDLGMVLAVRDPLSECLIGRIDIEDAIGMKAGVDTGARIGGVQAQAGHAERAKRLGRGGHARPMTRHHETQQPRNHCWPWMHIERTGLGQRPAERLANGGRRCQGRRVARAD
jgi:hypothetical protein